MLCDGSKKTVLSLVAVAVLLSAGAAVSHAQQHQDARRQQMMERLDVTPEQMQQFKSIREDARAEAEVLQRQIRQKRQALMQYVQSPDASEAQALAMNRELSALTARMGELRIKAAFRMKETMTPEQFERFARHRQQARERMMDQMQNRMQQRREGGGGFQGGGSQDRPRRRWQPQGN